jgi:hypothetical protein
LGDVKKILKFLVALAAVALIWVWRPLFHSVVFDAIYLGLPIIILFALVIVAALVLISARSTTRKAIGILAVLLFALLLVGYLISMGPLTGSALISSIQPTELNGLPETDNIRYLPVEVAETIAQATTTNSLYNIGDIDPFDYRRELSFVAPRIPNGPWNWLYGNANGILIVSSNTSMEKPDVRIIEESFKYGEGMGITDSVYWQFYATDFMCDVPEVYYIITDAGELIALAPYIKYDFRFPVFVPYWGGVFVTHPDGQIENLDPGQAVSDPRFKNQRLYPETLARWIGESWQYRNGILNAWFTHNDQAELNDPDDAVNKMPYLLPTNEGVVWFNGFKPHGNAQSIYKIQFIDARTGAVSIYNIPSVNNWIGPNKAIQFVKTAFPTLEWAENIKAIEPRPIVHQGVLYWQISITNSQFAGLSKTALVNCDTQQVISFDNLKGLNDFLTSKMGEPVAKTITVAPSFTLAAYNTSTMTDRPLLEQMETIVD